MTLDSSALLAVLFSEAGCLALVDKMLEAEVLRIGAPTLVETNLVFESRLGRRQTDAKRHDAVHELVKELAITVVPFAEPEWYRAVEAFAKFGRGRHKAGLNFGDCLAYATASVAGDALLFVGDDFSHTDVLVA